MIPRATEPSDPWREWDARADAPVLWPLRLKERFRLPAGALTLCGMGLVLGVLWLTGALRASEVGPLAGSSLSRFGAGLFFAGSIGFLLEMATVVFPRARRDLLELRPHLLLPEERVERLAEGLVRYPRGPIVSMGLAGVAVGLLHGWLLGSFPPPISPFDPGVMAFSLATVAIWVLMFQIASVLLDNAALFARLGRQATRVDLYNTHRLIPFGRAALRPTLFLLVLQALYPLTLLGGSGVNPPVWIGLAATLGLVVLLFVHPLTGIHRSLVDARAQALGRLDERLAEVRHEEVLGGGGSEDLLAAQALLALREQVRGTSTWPVESGLQRRIVLYGVIPPVGWTLSVLLEVVLLRWIG